MSTTILVKRAKSYLFQNNERERESEQHLSKYDKFGQLLLVKVK